MPQRPTPRPRRDPSSSKRPMPRPSTREEREAGERGDRAARRDAGMKSGGKVKTMAKGGKTSRARDRATTRMPSGAQQYVRGDTAGGRMTTLAGAASAERRRNARGSMSEAEHMMTEGLIDEARRSDAARRNEREVGGRKAGGQMKTKKMAKGGMCRGMGAASRGGKYKSS